MSPDSIPLQKRNEPAADSEAVTASLSDATPSPSSSRKNRRRTTLSHISVGRRVVLTVNESEQLSIGEILDRIGCGWYQLQIFLSVFGALMAEASAVAITAGCVSPISAEFGIEDWPLAQAGFTGFLYMGIQVGTVVVGSIVDRFGRRPPLLGGYTGIIAFGVAAAFAGSVKALYITLFLLGFCGGLCVPCSVIMLSEVMPAKLRGGAGAALGVAFRCGTLWSALMLRVWMPDLDKGPWRYLMLAPVAPATVFLLFSLCSPAARQDTPHFLAVAGKDRALVSTLNLIAETNRKPEMRLVTVGDVRFEKAANSVTCGEVVRMMTSYPLWKHFLLIVVLFFCKEFVAGGTTAYWPVTFARLQSIAKRDKAALLQIAVRGMTASDQLIATELLSFPGIATAVVTLLYAPRKRALTMGASVVGTGGMLLLFLSGHPALLGVIGIGLIQLFFPTWQMVTMLLASEIFPTQVRGTAYSLSYFLGRFGSEAAQVAVRSSQECCFPVAVACLAVVALALVQLLPETKGAELANFCCEPEAQEARGYGATENTAPAARQAQV